MGTHVIYRDITEVVRRLDDSGKMSKETELPAVLLE